MKIFEGSNSQAGQESFVLNCLNEKKNGFYIEIGSNDPFAWSNTYILETKYGWSGLAFEIEQNLVDSYNNNRKNKCIQADATKFDYLKYFQEKNIPSRIDYLQLDIEPARQTLAAMYALPFNNYRFSVITFEHDLYSHKDNVLVKAESVEFLKSQGYILAVENVNDGIEERVFEDWWVDPMVINYDS